MKKYLVSIVFVVVVIFMLVMISVNENMFVVILFNLVVV